MPPFVRDPQGIIHKLVRIKISEGLHEWVTCCGDLVRFSEKWRSLHPVEGKATCLCCLAA
jgi:hypothetical protein